MDGDSVGSEQQSRDGGFVGNGRLIGDGIDYGPVSYKLTASATGLTQAAVGEINCDVAILHRACAASNLMLVSQSGDTVTVVITEHLAGTGRAQIRARGSLPGF